MRLGLNWRPNWQAKVVLQNTFAAIRRFFAVVYREGNSFCARMARSGIFNSRAHSSNSYGCCRCNFRLGIR